MKVIIFDEQHEEDLMNDINLFLKHHSVTIISMHYDTCCMAISDQQIYCFSCMIVYDE